MLPNLDNVLWVFDNKNGSCTVGVKVGERKDKNGKVTDIIETQILNSIEATQIASMMLERDKQRPRDIIVISPEQLKAEYKTSLEQRIKNGRTSN